MKVLVVDDNFTNRLLLQEILKQYGTVHIAVNGEEAVEAVVTALSTDEPYQLICLDIMMPEMDGQTALKKIRQVENDLGIFPSAGVKVIMTTALDDLQNIKQAYSGLCDGYLVKPIHKAKLLHELKQLGLI